MSLDGVLSLCFITSLLGGVAAIPVALVGGLVLLSRASERWTRAAWTEAGEVLGLGVTLGSGDAHAMEGVRGGRSVHVTSGAGMSLRGVVSMALRVNVTLGAPRLRLSTSRTGRATPTCDPAFDAAFEREVGPPWREDWPPSVTAVLLQQHRDFQLAGLGAGGRPDPRFGLQIDDGALTVAVPRVFRRAEQLIAHVRAVEQLADRVERLRDR